MKNRHPISEARAPEKTLSFWRAVRSLIESLWAQYGGPEAIAALAVLTRGEFIHIRAMLRGMEEVMRRLLFIEAADVTLTPGTSRKASAPPSRIEKEERDWDKPETWRVSFALNPARSIQRRRAISASSTPQRFVETWGLAARYEALLRVFDAPERHVRRAARLLQKLKPCFRLPRALPTWAGLYILNDMRPLMEEAGLEAEYFAVADTS